MRNARPLLIVLLAISHATLADTPTPVTHRQFQAVHADGSSSFDDAGPWQVVLEGILLNNPEEWLDPTPDPTIGPWLMGGEWEIFIQGEGDDHAGTFCWMGQNYGNGPGEENYTNQQWLDEIWRLNRDPNTGYVFHAGDRIRVSMRRGRSWAGGSASSSRLGGRHGFSLRKSLKPTPADEQKIL